MYYDDFELDCGCRMHCRCNERREAEVRSLRRRAERAEAALRGDSEPCPRCVGRGSITTGWGVAAQAMICEHCDGTGKVAIVIASGRERS